MRPMRPKNSSPWRCFVVRPPLRPASDRDILPFEVWGMRISLLVQGFSWLLPFGIREQTAHPGVSRSVTDTLPIDGMLGGAMPPTDARPPDAPPAGSPGPRLE